jgi:hypothetical protein
MENFELQSCRSHRKVQFSYKVYLHLSSNKKNYKILKTHWTLPTAHTGPYLPPWPRALADATVPHAPPPTSRRGRRRSPTAATTPSSSSRGEGSASSATTSPATAPRWFLSPRVGDGRRRGAVGARTRRLRTITRPRWTSPERAATSSSSRGTTA